MGPAYGKLVPAGEPGRPAPRPAPRLGPPRPRPPPPPPPAPRARPCVRRTPQPRAAAYRCSIYRLQPVSAGLEGAPPTMCCERGRARAKESPAWRARAGPRGRGRAGRAPARSRGRGSRKVTASPFRSAAGSRGTAPRPAAGILWARRPRPSWPRASLRARPGRTRALAAQKARTSGRARGFRGAPPCPQVPAAAALRRRPRPQGFGLRLRARRGRTGSFQFGCEPRAQRHGDPEVLPPAPTSPGFDIAPAASFPLGRGDGTWGPGELAAPLQGLASPLCCSGSSIAWRAGDVSERRAGQHPRPGARHPPSGREGGVLTGARPPNSRGLRPGTWRGCAPVRRPRPLGHSALQHATTQKPLGTRK